MGTVTFYEVNSVHQPSDAWGRTTNPIEGTTRGAVDELHTADINSEHWRGILKDSFLYICGTTEDSQKRR